MGQSAVFLSTCYYEGFNLPPLEAMSCAALVVGFHGYGGLEYATPDNGLWCAQGDLQDCLGQAGTSRGPVFTAQDPRLTPLQQNGLVTAERYRKHRTRPSPAQRLGEHHGRFVAPHAPPGRSMPAALEEGFEKPSDTAGQLQILPHPRNQDRAVPPGRPLSGGARPGRRRRPLPRPWPRRLCRFGPDLRADHQPLRAGRHGQDARSAPGLAPLPVACWLVDSADILLGGLDPARGRCLDLHVRQSLCAGPPAKAAPCPRSTCPWLPIPRSFAPAPHGRPALTGAPRSALWGTAGRTASRPTCAPTGIRQNSRPWFRTPQPHGKPRSCPFGHTWPPFTPSWSRAWTLWTWSEKSGSPPCCCGQPPNCDACARCRTFWSSPRSSSATRTGKNCCTAWARFQYLHSIDYDTLLPAFYTQSDIVFNCTSPQMSGALNQRLFDVPACGSFVLTDRQPELDEMFDIGTEIACYDSEQEVAGAMRHYLQNVQKRKEISRAGRKRVLAHHTYDHRLQRLIDEMRRVFGAPAGNIRPCS